MELLKRAGMTIAVASIAVVMGLALTVASRTAHASYAVEADSEHRLYEVSVNVTDGTNNTTADLTVTVTNPRAWNSGWTRA